MSFPLDHLEGVELVVPMVSPGSPYLSPILALPKVSIRVSFEIRASKPMASGADPTVTVKVRQGNSRENHSTLIDRALTVEAPFDGSAAIDNTGAEILLADDVVGGFVQLDISCTGGPCNLEVYARAL